MFGMFGTFVAHPGKRDELAELLREASQPMPGCRAYVVYLLPQEPDKVGVFEVWESREAHRASLQLPSVRGLIERARPLIAGPPESVEIAPLGGVGLLEADASSGA